MSCLTVVGLEAALNLRSLLRSRTVSGRWRQFAILAPDFVAGLALEHYAPRPCKNLHSVKSIQKLPR